MKVFARIKRSIGNTARFFKDGYNELKRVRWPNRKELTSYTIVVLVTVGFFTVYFAVIDLGISSVVRWIVG